MDRGFFLIFLVSPFKMALPLSNSQLMGNVIADEALVFRMKELLVRRKIVDGCCLE